MAILVTGAAGFIGFHVSRALLQRDCAVIGVDNLNAYYDPALKQARLALLEGEKGFRFVRLDIAEPEAVAGLADRGDIEAIVHLAAQAGVRHSLSAPFDYTTANVTGHLAMLELARSLPGLRHFVYASSSSVYGGNAKLPFSVADRVDAPVSLYAATKRAGELMSHVYAHLYGIRASGLRFFTVYGPWGRPDMAAYLFADAIASGQPIRLFNGGRMSRDFTYIDDIVAGILGVLDNPPRDAGEQARIFNIGNNRPEDLGRFVSLIERSLGRKAKIVLSGMQMGDVTDTYADIEPISKLCGFVPTTPIEIGIPRFVDWFCAYRGLRSPQRGQGGAAASAALGAAAE